MSENVSLDGLERVRGVPIKNVGELDRIISTALGTILTYEGLKRFSGTSEEMVKGSVFSLVGGYLLYRGLSGHCYAYDLAGISSDTHDLHGGYGFLVEK